MFKLIPLPYKILGAAFALMCIILAAEYDGAARVRAKWDSEKAAQAEAKAKIETAQAAATVQVVTQYVDRIIKVKESTNANQSHALSLADNCRLSAGWRVLHDAAASAIPATPEELNGPGSGVDATAALRTVIENYGIANQCREQVTAWQEWATKMQGAE